MDKQIDQQTALPQTSRALKRNAATSSVIAALGRDKLRATDEQAHAVAAFNASGSLKIIAGAGTGKTSTLKLIGESTSRRGLYIAFNTAMADDAKRRMPPNVSASTAHSLAFRHVDPGFRTKIGSRLPAGMAAEAGGIRSMIDLPGKNKDGDRLVISQATAGYFMLDWVRRHCMSAEAEISKDNAPAGRMLAIMGIEREAATPQDWSAAREIAGTLLPATHRLWERMRNPRDAFPAQHDTYLKVWALSNPKIAADFILFDEAQDANALMLQIVGNQPAQKVYVGDPNQQIYAWRDAVNAMQSIQTDHEARLTESFRFGPEIAEFANHALALCGSDLRLTGKAPAGRDFSHGGKPRVATLCRTNASVVRELMLTPDLSRAHVAGGVSQIVGLLNGMRELRDNDRTGNPELCHFKGWQELVMHAASEADDLAALFKLTEDGDRIEPLAAMLEKTARVAKPDSHVISTAHKCKGLEWADVRLAGDFRTPGHKRWSVEEANLLYVAGTRGMRSLSLDGVLADGLGLGGKSSYREAEAAPQAVEREQKREPSRPRRSEEVGVGF
ncbi:putative DNA helicase (Modular protein) [Thiomonas sp. X19]|uniref:UvrD-helicase domain-containing protein n=1 Tax=Thiomonas sp. X19 TaxID=1050370 RepID=UPI000B719A58|nr:UvrD-helicase domain-containing protein [Thiomonas sp. X19]SCC94690.1 putative DNA helicase (Modular protein) [Thiomonas sp. X19]